MLWYVYGGKAPSAKETNDLSIYELALDMHLHPDIIRAMSPRDRNNLVIVNKARKSAVRQIAQNNKVPSSCPIEV